MFNDKYLNKMDSFYFQRSLNFSIIYFLFFSLFSGVFLFSYKIFSFKYYFSNVFISLIIFIIFLAFLYEGFIKKNYTPLILILLMPLLILVFKSKIIVTMIYIIPFIRLLKNYFMKGIYFQTTNKKSFFLILLFTIFVFTNIFIKNHSLPSDFIAIFNLDIHTDTAVRLAVAEIFKNYYSISSGVGSVAFTFSSFYSEIFFGSIIWLFNLKSYEFFYWFHYGFFYSLVIFLFTFFLQIAHYSKKEFKKILSLTIFFTLAFFIIKPETFSNLFGNSPFSFSLSVLLIMLVIVYRFLKDFKSPNYVLFNLMIFNILIILSKTILAVFSLLICSYLIHKTKYSTKLKVLLLFLFYFFSFLLAYLAIYQFISNNGIAFFSSSILNFNLFTFFEILFAAICLTIFFKIFKLKKNLKYHSVEETNLIVYFIGLALIFIFCLRLFNFVGPQYFWLKITSIIFFFPLVSIFTEISIKKIFKVKYINLFFISFFFTVIYLNLYTSKYQMVYNKIKFTHQSNLSLLKDNNSEFKDFKNLINKINVLTDNAKSDFVINIPKSNYLFWDISSSRDCNLSNFIFQNLTGIAILHDNKRIKTTKCKKNLTPDFRVKRLDFSGKNFCDYLLRNTEIGKIIYINEKKLLINNIKKCK